MSEPKLVGSAQLGTALESALAIEHEAEHISNLHLAFAAKAQSQGLIDISYRLIDSPLGSLLLAASKKGIVRVAFASEGHDSTLQELATKISPRVLANKKPFDSVAKEIDEYFAGSREHFDAELDVQLAAGFRREVLDHLGEIPYGATRSYAGVAATTSSPKAVRAVGTACAKNPLPLLLPCHRVVRSDGSPGAYLGGAEAKMFLLTLERSNAG